MSEELMIAFVPAVISALISIVGFILTNRSMKTSFVNELKKQRDSIALEKMEEMPFKILDLIDPKQEKSVSTRNRELKEIMNKIISYGTKEALKIVAFLQTELYSHKGNQTDLDKYNVMAKYVLLAMQIKYDITGISISPELWYQIRINDYCSIKESIKTVNCLFQRKNNTCICE